MKRMPSAYACPVVPTRVMALSCVAITDNPTAHQGRLRFARKYPSTSVAAFVRLRPSTTIQTRYAATTIQSSARIGRRSAREGTAHDPERSDHGGVTQEDERVRAAHGLVFGTFRLGGAHAGRVSRSPNGPRWRAREGLKRCQAVGEPRPLSR